MQPDWSFYWEEKWNGEQVAEEITWSVCLPLPPSPPFLTSTYWKIEFYFILFFFEGKKSTQRSFHLYHQITTRICCWLNNNSLFYPLGYKISHRDSWNRVKNYTLNYIFFKLLKFKSVWPPVFEDLWRNLFSPATSLPVMDCLPGNTYIAQFQQEHSCNHIQVTLFCFLCSLSPEKVCFSLWGQEKRPMSQPGHFYWVFFLRDALASGILCPDLVWLSFYFPLNYWPFL